MKKIIALLLCLCTLAALGCTALASESASTAGTNTNTDPIVVEDGVTVLAFTGDQHGETDNYHSWISDILGVYGDQLAMLSYSGDICNKNWEQDVYEGFVDVLEQEVPGRYNVTTGNQEFKSGAPGNDWDALGEGFTRIGEVVATDDYIIYDLGSAQENMVLPQEDIDAVAAYLDAAPTDVPIFILSHYPLHLSVGTDSHSIPGQGNYRQLENNAALIEVLNEHPNVIFLWGHNHTFADPRYGTIRGAGSSFTYDYENPTDKVELNFTYANYGCFCRGDSYGVVAEVTRTDAGVQVSMHFIDEDVYMTNKDAAVITVAADGTVTTDITDGDGVDLDEILSMSGYPDDPDFIEEF